MARTSAEEPTTAEIGFSRISASLVGGIVAGMAMGLVIQFGTDLMPIFGRLLGERSAIRGWIVHLTVSGSFGVLFGMFESLPFFRELANSVTAYVLLGIIHASVLATILIGVVLPIVSNVLGVVLLPIPGTGVGDGTGDSSIGLIHAIIFAVAHLIYGVGLGATYAVLRGRGSEE